MNSSMSNSGIGRRRSRTSQSKMRFALEKMKQESRSVLQSGDIDHNVKQNSSRKSILKKKKPKATSWNPKLISKALLLLLGASHLGIIVYKTYAEFSPSPWNASIINALVKRSNDTRIPLIPWLTRLNDAKDNAVRTIQNIISSDPVVEEPPDWKSFINEWYSKIRSAVDGTMN